MLVSTRSMALLFSLGTVASSACGGGSGSTDAGGDAARTTEDASEARIDSSLVADAASPTSDAGPCGPDLVSCHDECVDPTRELWEFRGVDGCDRTNLIYVRVDSGSVVTIGNAHDYPVWTDTYDCDDDGTPETPSTAEVGELQSQPFVDGTCASHCVRGAGYREPVLTRVEGVCFEDGPRVTYVNLE